MAHLPKVKYTGRMGYCICVGYQYSAIVCTALNNSLPYTKSLSATLVCL